MQMELEAENLWIRSASHDFYDKTNFIKKYCKFLIEKVFAEKNSGFFAWSFFENNSVLEFPY